MTESENDRPPRRASLSARLLVLTVFFIMLSELLIYAPSIARFRKTYMEDHISKAHLASLALEATPDNMVSKDLERELLFHADAYGITLRHPDRRVLMISEDMPPKVDVTFDLRRGSWLMWLSDAFAALRQKSDRVMRIVGLSPKDPEVVIELVLDELPMRQAMYDYSGRILQLSIVISLITGVLVYLSLQWLTVRPMRRLTAAMTAFQEDPEDESRTIVPSRRGDEVGVAERELQVMQNEVRAAMQQKSRLATLGAAVAKINHDLRNSLATAVLVSDRLADIDDPEVKRVTPRLYTAIDRAVTLCSQTLNYVAHGAPQLQPTHFHLRELVAEVQASLRDPDVPAHGLEWDNKIDPVLDVVADREQLFRVFSNLADNAHRAGAETLTVNADMGADGLTVDFTDDGPGMPETAREKLFQPFVGSARDGGTGLGLVIVRDILRAHGGDVSVTDTSDSGTTFRLSLPPPRGGFGG